MKKKLISLLLVLAMLLTLMPAMAFATEPVNINEILKAANEYEYSPTYTYAGDRVIDGTTIYYIISESAIGDGSPIMNDLARFLGALYRNNTAKATSITYGETEYTWVTEGVQNLKGSNWRDESGKTLISAITDDFSSQCASFATGGATITLVINGKTVTIDLIVPTGLRCTGTENVDYEWDDNKLCIKTDNQTVYGATKNQYITVANDVETLTLDGVKIIPTEKKIVHVGITSEFNRLTVILKNENVIGKAVPDADKYEVNAEYGENYTVKSGFESNNDVTFKGEGSLTIHSLTNGIKAKSVTLNENFEGALTVNNYGYEPEPDSPPKDYTPVITNAVEVINGVTVEGGEFTVKCYAGDGIHAGGNVTITDATVTINSGRDELDPGTGIGVNGIYVENGDVKISGTADAASGGQDYGVYVKAGNITVGENNDDSVKQVLADGKEGGIKADNGNIDIKAGNVKARSHRWGIGVGTQSGGTGNITVSGNKTKVVAFGGVEDDSKTALGCGIYAVSGDVTISGGAGVIAKGYVYGIGASGNVQIQGTTTNVNAEGGYSYGEEVNFVNDSTEKGSRAFGIFANGDFIKIQGGTVVAHGYTAALNKVPDLNNYKYSGNPSAAVLGCDDEQDDTKQNVAEWTNTTIPQNVEIFSKILKEELSVHAQKNEAQIDGKTVTDAKLSCYGITYDKTNEILTLDGLTQTLESKKTNTTDSVYAIKLPAGITIVLKGVNSITAPKTSASQKMACGIFSSGDLTIKGDDTAPGTLTINGGTSSKGLSYGIYAAGDLSIDGDPTMTVNGGNGMKVYGIYSKGDAAISSGTISAEGKTAAVAVDTANSKTLTVGAIGTTATIKNATANNAEISKSNGAITGGVLTSTVSDNPVVISFKPIIIVTKDSTASFPIAGEANAEYQLYTVSAENFAEAPTLKLEWKNTVGGTWDASAPTGVKLGTDGKITTTAETAIGDYIFRITNGENETLDTPNPGTPNPEFVCSDEITLTITEASDPGGDGWCILDLFGHFNFKEFGKWLKNFINFIVFIENVKDMRIFGGIAYFLWNGAQVFFR